MGFSENAQKYINKIELTPVREDWAFPQYYVSNDQLTSQANYFHNINIQFFEMDY